MTCLLTVPRHAGSVSTITSEDLGQCIVGTRVVQLDRRRGVVRDEAGVVEKFGVVPESIPDYLALGPGKQGRVYTKHKWMGKNCYLVAALVYARQLFS